MKKFDLNLFLKPNILKLKPYPAKEILCKVRLDANESPYVFKISQGVIKKVSTNRYPDPTTKRLRALLAKQLRVKPGNLLMGNGSDEIIYYLITTFGGPIIYPIPTFSMYGIIAQALGEDKIEIPLDKSFDLDLPNMVSAIKKVKPKLIFLSSPNNPTGNCFSTDKILRIIKESNSIVVVDEAYQPFSRGRGFLPLLRKHKNLLILKSMSKIGLAGLRMGFLIADKGIIKEINKVRLPFNLNSLSQAIAFEFLNAKKQMLSYIRLIVKERQRLYKELKKIDSIIPYPSEANFILFRVKDPKKVYKGLLKKGVLIRNMHGSVDKCLRVTVGRKKEDDIFLKALKEVMKSHSSLSHNLGSKASLRPSPTRL